jgi:hypothetical protein
MPKWLQIVWGLAAVLVIVGSVSFLVALYVHTNLYPPSIGGVAVSSQAQSIPVGPIMISHLTAVARWNTPL